MNEPLIKLRKILQEMQMERRWSSGELARRARLSAGQLRAYETGSAAFSPQIGAKILLAMAEAGPWAVIQGMLEPDDSPPQWLLNQMEAQMKHLEAALCIDEGRLREALILTDRSLLLDPRPERRGRVLLTKAAVLGELGRAAHALDALAEAETCLDPEREPALWLRLRLEQVYLYCQEQRQTEALTWQAEARDLAAHVGRDRERLQVRLLDGWIAAASGQTAEALGLLREVREGLLAAQRIFDATAVGLDLSALLVEMGLLPEIKELARHLEDHAAKIPSRARAPLKVFLWAVRRGSLTADMARQLAAELRRGGGRLTRPYVLPV